MRLPCSNQTLFLAGAFGAAILALSVNYSSKPRVHAVNEVPIAFWAWKTRAPESAEVQKAFAATNAKVLFLRAGQIDVIGEKMQRIRPISGNFPAPFEIHLVYNGTRRFLRDWDRLDPAAIAGTVADTYQADILSGNADHADLSGLQLDLDVPTRLLPKYAQVLAELRKILPHNTKLSITGLPTWTESSQLIEVLANVDFWIPQCYGSEIPKSIDRLVPISSAKDVESTIDRVRGLNKPYYAGLSAYGYAVLYGKDGRLVELRGDLDIAAAELEKSLEPINTSYFKGDVGSIENRRVYRAIETVVLDGLIVEPGEMLMFDIPTSASLRASAAAVRAAGGDRLLGICIFRLPTAEDTTTLSLAEIAAALTDTKTEARTAVSLNLSNDGQLTLNAENAGTATSLVGNDALTIDVVIPGGAASGVSNIFGFSAFETMCGSPTSVGLTACSPMRANVIRLRSNSWKPGSTASSVLTVRQDLPDSLTAEITVHIDDGRIVRRSLNIPINNVGDQNEKRIP